MPRETRFWSDCHSGTQSLLMRGKIVLRQTTNLCIARISSWSIYVFIRIHTVYAATKLQEPLKGILLKKGINPGRANANILAISTGREGKLFTKRLPGTINVGLASTRKISWKNGISVLLLWSSRRALLPRPVTGEGLGRREERETQSLKVRDSKKCEKLEKTNIKTKNERNKTQKINNSPKKIREKLQKQ